MAWTKVDLYSANAMDEAIAFCRSVMKKWVRTIFVMIWNILSRLRGGLRSSLLLTRMYLHSALRFVELGLCDFLRVELFYLKKILSAGARSWTSNCLQ